MVANIQQTSAICVRVRSNPGIINHYVVSFQKANYSRLRITMKKYLVNTIFAILLVFSQLKGSIATEIYPVVPQGIFDYQERVGKKVIPFNWQAEENENGVTINVFEEKKSFYNFCTADGKTLKWRITEEGRHDISAVRLGDELHISGIRDGQEYKDTISIDERPWYQPLSFSLGKFLNSTDQETAFWVIRADTIEVIALTARKIGEEVLHVEDMDVVSQMIEIRAEGFFSNFWSARYWYRKSDKLFLRYQSVHGLPGTDETIVELIKSPSDQIGG